MASQYGGAIDEVEGVLSNLGGFVEQPPGSWSRDGVGLTVLADGFGDLWATALVNLSMPESKVFVRIVAGP